MPLPTGKILSLQRDVFELLYVLLLAVFSSWLVFHFGVASVLVLDSRVFATTNLSIDLFRGL